LSYLADTQTDKQTKSGKNITSLVEVKVMQYLVLSKAWWSFLLLCLVIFHTSLESVDVTDVPVHLRVW